VNGPAKKNDFISTKEGEKEYSFFNLFLTSKTKRERDFFDQL